MPIRSDTLDSFDDEDDEFGNNMDLDEEQFWDDFYDESDEEWDDDSSREMWPE